jgi:glucose/arabinose dehydrogenase
METAVLTQAKHFTILLLLSFIGLSPILSAQVYCVEITEANQTGLETTGPTMENPNFGVEVITTGIEFPSDMAFLETDDILVLEKNSGNVLRVKNGQILDSPLLEVSVSNSSERGLLGIAVAKASDEESESTYVYLQFTEDPKNRDSLNSGFVANRVYRYELVDNHLINPSLLLDLPAYPNPYHNGGKIIVGPDNNLYVAVGDMGLGRREIEKSSTVQNNREGPAPDGRAGILRITQDGQPVDGRGILGDEHPLNVYYAYGIRNSFGMDFDPVTGVLWDTENGPNFGDEINLVKPGFNSGWNKIQGFWMPDGEEMGELKLNPGSLMDFNGNGEYSAPEFVWNYTVGATAVRFFDSDRYGEQFKNDMFVGDFNNGNLYHFDLNEDRTELSLDGDLDDKVADLRGEANDTIFGKGFVAITDMEISPDGYLYVLSLQQSGDDCDPRYINCVSYDSSIDGTLFKIYPTKEPQKPS